MHADKGEDIQLKDELLDSQCEAAPESEDSDQSSGSHGIGESLVPDQKDGDVFEADEQDIDDDQWWFPLDTKEMPDSITSSMETVDLDQDGRVELRRYEGDYYLVMQQRDMALLRKCHRALQECLFYAADDGYFDGTLDPDELSAFWNLAVPEWFTWNNANIAKRIKRNEARIAQQEDFSPPGESAPHGTSPQRGGDGPPGDAIKISPKVREEAKEKA